MNRKAILAIAALGLAGGFALYTLRPSAPPPPQSSAPPPLPVPKSLVGATMLEGLGNYEFKITTDSPQAQRWFNQGLSLTYGFNHDAAERSFLKATEQDPECAMCWWGAALVLGPHVNSAMDPANNAKAWVRVQKANALAGAATPREQAYIKALSARYAAEPPADRKPLDEAYAAAAGELAKAHPDDQDAATFHAEALMDLQPWDYYDAQRKPRGNTAQIVSTLESVMARNADHFGALHLYIHAVEASSDPDRGAVAADRLRELVPGSGHLVHMPAHIYTRVGRYHDAAVANQKAIRADDSYLAACKPAPGVYPLGYVPHNHHFLWWASSMEGAGGTALAAAEETAKRAWIPDLIKTEGFAFLQDFWMTPLKARVQLGRWDEIVASPKPSDDMPYPVAIWNFAQGMAAVRQNRLDEARKHLDALALAAADPAMEKLMVGPMHPLSGTLQVAERVLSGELLAVSGDKAGAIAALKQGVAIEDGLNYYEPPLWHHPVRQTLGAVLLDAGKAAEAEKVYREDLERNRNNGWSLFGLAQSQRAQKKAADADATDALFKAAWQNADVQLTASRM